MNPLKQLAARGAIYAQRYTGSAGQIARRTSDIVETWFHAQEGPAILRGVAAVSILSQLADLVHTMWDFDQLIVAAGWELVPMGKDAHTALITRLRPFALRSPDIEDDDGEGLSVLTWVDEHGRAVVMATENRWDEKFAEVEPGALDALIGFHVWSQPILEVVRTTDEDGRHTVTLNPCSEPDRTLVGNQVQSVQQACVVSEDTRIVAVLGSTGSGKTSSVYQALSGRRVLCNVGNVLSPSSLMVLVRTLKPDVVVLDDLEMSDDFDAGLGRALDQLHQEVPLVIITVMLDEFLSVEEMEAGAMYWSGMRPGRIDQFVFIGKLDDGDRAKVLDLYGCPPSLLAEAVAGTGCLSAAYLRETALRLKAGGDLATTLRDIRLQAPIEMSPDGLDSQGKHSRKSVTTPDENEDSP